MLLNKVCTIAEFINQHCSRVVNMRAWRWASDPISNVANLAKYMKEGLLPEAPDLDEDCHLRSYAGDSVGRGAGIYDCATDMFFPWRFGISGKNLPDTPWTFVG